MRASGPLPGRTVTVQVGRTTRAACHDPYRGPCLMRSRRSPLSPVAEMEKPETKQTGSVSEVQVRVLPGPFHSRKGGEQMASKVTLAGARVSAGLTQEQMAAKMGVTRRTISAWENGDTAIGTAQLIAWCTVTGFRTEDISLPSESALSEV